MKIEDCEVGMKVRYKEKNSCSFDKGEELIIKECYKSNEVEFEDGRYTHPDYIEPVNKFEVGNEAIWRNSKVEIWGKRYDEEMKEYEYAVVDKNNGRTLLFESELLPLKKPDELEVGDKFKSKNKEFVEVIAKENDIVNTVYYFGKTNCNKISVWNEYDVDKIIYD